MCLFKKAYPLGFVSTRKPLDMTSYNVPSPRGFIIFILFIATLMYVSYIISSCKNKQVQCEAYSEKNIKSDSLLFNLSEFQQEDTIYDDSWQDEDWFEDDRLACRAARCPLGKPNLLSTVA